DSPPHSPPPTEPTLITRHRSIMMTRTHVRADHVADPAGRQRRTTSAFSLAAPTSPAPITTGASNNPTRGPSAGPALPGIPTRLTPTRSPNRNTSRLDDVVNGRTNWCMSDSCDSRGGADSKVRPIGTSTLLRGVAGGCARTPVERLRCPRGGYRSAHRGLAGRGRPDELYRSRQGHRLVDVGSSSACTPP